MDINTHNSLSASNPRYRDSTSNKNFTSWAGEKIFIHPLLFPFKIMENMVPLTNFLLSDLFFRNKLEADNVGSLYNISESACLQQ
jgi:hypothetical protein